MKATEKTPAANPLEGLAVEADGLIPPLGEGNTLADVAEREAQEREEEQAAEGMKQMDAMATGLVFLGLKFGRRLMAKQLPEVNETLPDETLSGSAQAALPLVKKHLGGLMETASKSPELAALLMGLVPVAMGIVAALELSQRRAEALPTPAPGPLPEVPEA